MALDLTDLEGIATALMADSGNHTLWGIFADALEEEGRDLMFLVVLRIGGSAGQVLGVYRRLDGAFLAAEKAILANDSHYVSGEVLEVYPDREGKQHIFTVQRKGIGKGSEVLVKAVVGEADTQCRLT